MLKPQASTQAATESPTRLDPSQIPLALYIHLPWCVRKCPYCDFNSHAAENVPEAQYVAALLADLEHDLPLTFERPLVSIFLGGGTPSLFSGAAINALLRGVARRVPFAADIEITLEANPGAVDEAHFAGYREAGVNRLSIGVQSMRQAQLTRLGRVHGTEDAARAVAVAQAAGFENLNLDLIYGLPGDRKGDSLRDLEALLAFAPQHVSWYQLTLEPGTAFAHRPPRLPPEGRIAEESEQGVALLATAGFHRYEVSAYARAGHEARHNLNYWQFGDYLGLGAGAHGKLSTAEGVLRTTRRRHPQAYMKESGNESVRTLEPVPTERLPIEFMLNALRLAEGFPEALFAARTGLPLSDLLPAVMRAMDRGWMSRHEGELAATPLGYRFLDDLQLLFLP
ncbi:MAG: radical SAM family heme chaperone HemW [Gammaproteobacteria bacterium]|nr:radical SAM family heme chaperone HemW [Gammaproteobacteria bacterium]